MFDIGWTEMLVIAIVMIVVVGPKDLPKMLRTFGRTTTKLRSMAGDFQKQFNEALKEAELDEVKKTVDGLRNPVGEIRKQLNPFEKAAADVRAGLDAALKQSTTLKPAEKDVHAAEPLKNGAAPMPDVPGPSVMPTPPVIAQAGEGAAAKRAEPATTAAKTNGAAGKASATAKSAAAKAAAGKAAPRPAAGKAAVPGKAAKPKAAS
ncbi:MAG: Sec-independent protein translocase protein TatB [Rhizobiaceae bacterium]